MARSSVTPSKGMEDGFRRAGGKGDLVGGYYTKNGGRLPRLQAEAFMRARPKVKATTAEVADEGQPAPAPLGPWKPTGRAVLSMKEAAYVLNIGLTFLGELVKNGNLPVLRLGKRTLVPVTAIEDLLKQAS
jgi:excisionase family DNA binding protein